MTYTPMTQEEREDRLARIGNRELKVNPGTAEKCDHCGRRIVSLWDHLPRCPARGERR